MSSTKKIEEALAHIKEAEKGLKTGFLKWKPDYDIAADEYNYAATCYKTAKQHSQCRDCLLKASENYQICRSYFSAAKCLEQAANVSKELGEMKDIGQLSEKAAVLYRNHGVPETAAMTLEKGAKMIETTDLEKCIHLYKFAVDIISTEDKHRQAADIQSKISRLFVKHKRYDEAVDALRKEIAYHQYLDNRPGIGRLTVALVMVQIARGDHVAAEKVFREWGGYCEMEEVRTLESLLQAFDEEDGALARRALNQPFIKHMDIEYARLSRDLPVPKIIEKPTDAPGGPSAAAPADDDEELNLC